jgi:hypothetical protein
MTRPGRFWFLLGLLFHCSCALTRADGFLQVNGAQAVEGEVRLRCEPQDAEVSLDSVPIGTCADFAGQRKVIHVGKTTRRLSVKKTGHWPWSSVVEAERTRVSLDVTLLPMASP